MNIKWVKILNRKTDFVSDAVVDALVAAGMMPVMRIQENEMEALYPPEVEALVRHYRLRGVYYYELYNEPNLLDEWPVGAEMNISRVADVWIPAAEAIQRAGGFPSTPGLAPGGHWEDMDFFRNFLAEVRRRAQSGDDKAYRVLCGDGSGRLPTVWVAVHNYGLNHYFDYPRDPVNLTGTPVTAAEATYYGIQSNLIHGLNEVRTRNDRPFHVGDRLLDDSNGFFKFWAYAEIYQEVIGYIPPILVTEGGWLPGEQQDPRYPPVTDAFQTNETLRAYEYMLEEAPDFLISWMPWILCNFACNGTDGRFEPHAWYKGRSTTDTLPVVQAMKRNPNRFLTRTIPDRVNLPWPDWVGQGPVGLPANITLVRTPIDLVLNAAARLGRTQFVALGGNDQIRVLPDPLALTNRFLVKNVSSRQARVNLGGEPLELAGYGTAVVEIRPQMAEADVGEAEPVELSEQYAGRVEIARLPEESDIEFQARTSAVTETQGSVLPISDGQAALKVDNEFPFGVASFHRLSCDENQRMANLVFVKRK